MNLFLNNQIQRNRTLLDIMFGRKTQNTKNNKNVLSGRRDTVTISSEAQELSVKKSISGRTRNISVDSTIDLQKYVDAAYKKTVDSFVTMEQTNQHAREIIGEEAEKIAKISRRSTTAADFLKEQKARGTDKVPENLNEKMLSAVVSFREKYAAFNPNAGRLSQLLAGIKISQ